MARKKDPIKRIELGDGRVKYEFVIDVGRHPDGRRHQIRVKKDTYKEAKVERARVIHERAKGTYVVPSKLTVAEYLPQWLAGKRNLKRGTRRTYRDNLKPVIARCGKLELQEFMRTKVYLDNLVNWMLTQGWRSSVRAKRDAAIAFLKTSLTAGQRPLAELKREARQIHGLSEDTFERACRELGVIATTRQGAGRRKFLALPSGAKGPTPAGTRGLAGATVNRMLTVLSQAMEDAEWEGLISRNLVPRVERASEKKPEMKTWRPWHAESFLNFVEDDRLYTAWECSLYGLRRGEVLGLRRDDVDLTGALAQERGLPAGTPTISIQIERVSVSGEVVEDEPKSIRGKRVLPLDEDMVAAFEAMFARQDAEREAAASAYAGPCRLCGGVHLVVDELGRPYRPEWYSDRFRWLAGKAGLPVIRLHDARHTCGTLMHLRGVPVAVISAWLGHASADFTMRTYVHSQPEALVAAGQTLRRTIRRRPRPTRPM